MAYSLEPTPKSDGINDLLRGITGKDRVDTIKGSSCMTCDDGLLCTVTGCGGSPVDHNPGHPFTPFRDSLSNKEYTISGMCQACQDQVFGV
jgi:hypothetical protein